MADRSHGNSRRSDRRSDRRSIPIHECTPNARCGCVRLGPVDSGIVPPTQLLSSLEFLSNPVEGHLYSQLKMYIVPWKILCLIDSVGDEDVLGYI